MANDYSKGVREFRRSKGYKPLTPEQQAARKLQEQMADIEFQMDIAPYFDYKADIDPSIARYRGFRTKADKNLNLGGFYVPPENSEAPYSPRDLKPFTGMVGGKRVSIPVEPGTVNAVHNKATPNVWAHEYRHQMGEDGGGERYNRLADAATAQNGADWSDAVMMWRDQLARDGKKVSPSEAERDLLTALKANHAVTPRSVYEADYSRGARRPDTEPAWWQRPSARYEQARIDASYWKRRDDELKKFDKWNAGLPKRNTKRGQAK